MNKKIKPLYMWAGGKTKLLERYLPLFPSKESYSTYIEPFFGGGAVFTAVKQNNPNVPCIINDLSKEIISIFDIIKNADNDFIKNLEKLEKEYLILPPRDSKIKDKDPKFDEEIKKKNNLRKELFYLKRKEYWNMPLGTPESVALLYFLMKTAFNGIWQECKESNGKFGTPAGLLNQKSDLFDYQLIKDWESLLNQNTTILSGDYKSIEVPNNSWVYCDPPYRDSFTTYSKVFGDKEQLELIEWCRKLHNEKGCTVWLANREAGDNFFEDHASDAELHKFDIVYTAGRRKQTDTGYEAKKAEDLLLIWK